NNDMGAICPGRWQSWHFSCKIGAMSFENVTGLVLSCPSARRALEVIRKALRTSALTPILDHVPSREFILAMTCSLSLAKEFLSVTRHSHPTPPPPRIQ